MKNTAALFDKALDYHHLSKKEFSKEGQIPYDTVAGWKKRGEVPPYAIVLLKKIAHQRKMLYTPHHQNIGTYTGRKVIEPKLAKRIEVAFWGKALGYEEIIRRVRKAEPDFVKPFFENLYFKDVIAVLGQKQIAKLLPVLNTQFDSKTASFWKRVAVAEIAS